MNEKLEELLFSYIEEIRNDLSIRWKSLPLDFSEIEKFEVVGGLLARQVSLAGNIARSPGTWNEHVAPILLRSMADLYITMAWIFKEPLTRSRKYIMYGLGQSKLQVEHRKNQLQEDGIDPEEDPFINSLEKWATYQRYPFLTEVNVGSWSGISTRDMADEADCLDFYRYVYTPFSSAVHSMWHHVGRFNLEPCSSPLHRGHKLPIDRELDLHPHYLYLAAKYMNKTFNLFDDQFDLEVDSSKAMDKLTKRIDELDYEEE